MRDVQVAEHALVLVVRGELFGQGLRRVVQLLFSEVERDCVAKRLRPGLRGRGGRCGHGRNCRSSIGCDSEVRLHRCNTRRAFMQELLDVAVGLLSQEPASLVVPAALEMVARQLVATFTAVQAGDVQPFTLSVVVEPRLDAVSAKTWYLVAARQSALEYGYLDGAEGVQIIQREGFEVDGLEIKARLDFGCGWGSPVGWVKSNGDGVGL